MTIKKRFIFAYLGAICITLFSFVLIFSLISYSSLGRVPSVSQLYRILTMKRPLTPEEEESFISISELLKQSPKELEEPFSKDLLERIHTIEQKQLNVVIRKENDFPYHSSTLLERSLRVHAPAFELNNLEPTGTIDNNGRFFHYIKTDFQYQDGTRGSFYILKRESNLYEFFIRFGIWLVLLIFGGSVLAFWYISRCLSKTVVQPLISLERNTREIMNNKEISPVDSFTEVEHSSEEIERLQQSFKKMWMDLYHAQGEKKKYEENRKELISNISHDLKTPMTSIIGYVEGLKDGVANTEEKRQAYLNTIHEKSLSLNEMIDELFLYSKLDIDSLHIKMEKIDFIPYIENMVKEFRWDESVEVKVHAPKKKLFVMLNIGQFDRIMSNLIQNSIKFKDPKKERLILNITISEKGKEIQFDFEDNGIGVLEEEIPRIFDRFYRVDKSRTPTVKGSGLGLSIVKHMVENHHGRIEAKSQIGKGLKISILLPKLEEENHDERTNFNY